MGVEIDIQGDKKIMDALSTLSDKEIARAAVAAGKRAATAARQAGTKEIRSIYTMKAGDLKAKAQIRADEDGATILVKGAPEAIHKYQAKKRRDGVFVSVKRGKMTHVPRGFSLGGAFVARKGKERYPLKGIYGPAVPQLFGNPDVLSVMMDRGSDVFEERLEHEIEYRLGK